MDQNTLLGYFGSDLKKAIVIYKISTLKLIKYEFLTNNVIFGIGSTFSEGPGSAFFWEVWVHFKKYAEG